MDGKIKLSSAGIRMVAVLDAIESDLIYQAMVMSHGNRTAAACLLGINRTTFTMKAKRLGLLDVDFKSLSNSQHADRQ